MDGHRGEAAFLRQRAEGVHDDLVRYHLLNIAEQYKQLADAIDRIPRR